MRRHSHPLRSLQRVQRRRERRRAQNGPTDRLDSVAVLPTWPYSVGWGFYPSSGLGLILIIIIILAVAGLI